MVQHFQYGKHKSGIIIQLNNQYVDNVISFLFIADVNYLSLFSHSFYLSATWEESRFLFHQLLLLRVWRLKVTMKIHNPMILLASMVRLKLGPKLT